MDLVARTQPIWRSEIDSMKFYIKVLMALMKISGIGLLFIARHLGLLRQYTTKIDSVNTEYQIKHSKTEPSV